MYGKHLRAYTYHTTLPGKKMRLLILQFAKTTQISGEKQGESCLIC